jgi:hypothetical protein
VQRTVRFGFQTTFTLNRTLFCHDECLVVFGAEYLGQEELRFGYFGKSCEWRCYSLLGIHIAKYEPESLTYICLYYRE